MGSLLMPYTLKPPNQLVNKSISDWTETTLQPSLPTKLIPRLPMQRVLPHQQLQSLLPDSQRNIIRSFLYRYQWCCYIPKLHCIRHHDSNVPVSFTTSGELEEPDVDDFALLASNNVVAVCLMIAALLFN